MNKNINRVNGVGEKLLFENNYFDVIFCSNGIDHYDNPQEVLSEIKRVLKKQGLLVLTVNVYEKDKGYIDKKHPYSYTEAKILEELHDFEILFNKKSSINAQFYLFMQDKIVVAEEKELILVCKYLRLQEIR